MQIESTHQLTFKKSPDGNAYAPAKEKILFLTKSKYHIQQHTEVLDFKPDLVDKNNKIYESALVKAMVTVFDKDVIIGQATGHCYRISTETYPAIETAETIATGRAISMLGISLEDCDIASAEEMKPRSRVYVNQGKKATKNAETEVAKSPTLNTEDFIISKKPTTYQGFPVYTSDQLRKIGTTQLYEKFNNIIPRFSNLESFFKLVNAKRTKGTVVKIIQEYYKGENPFKDYMRSEFNFDIFSGTLITNETLVNEKVIATKKTITFDEKKKKLNNFYAVYTEHCKEDRPDDLVKVMVTDLLVADVESKDIVEGMTALGFAAKYKSHFDFLKRCSAIELFTWVGYMTQE